MGLFSRNSAVSQQGHATQNEQLIELRQRARRRLIGALVIVLVAVIFVPIFLSSDGADEVEQVVHVFPPIVSPQADNSDLTAANLHSSEKVNDDTLDKVVNEHTNSTNEQELDQHTLHNSLETREESGESTGSTQNLEDADSAQLAESVEQIENLEPADEIKQETSQTKPKEHTQTEPKRTDDGSVALALLEGRMSPDDLEQTSGAQQVQSGGFIVQVAAYSSNESANNRRQQLSSAGVNNAFVDSNSSGSTHRLKVGPFETRQAAEAALTRLRSLGYEDSFIRTQ